MSREGYRTAPARLPLTYAKDRSAVDSHRLKWQGIGNLILGIACIGGTHGPAGVALGVIFIGLGMAVWIIAASAGWDWWSIPADYRRPVVGTGAALRGAWC